MQRLTSRAQPFRNLPPVHPHFSPPSAAAGSRSPSMGTAQNLIPIPTHSRSLSQPTFFNLDSLPPFSSSIPSPTSSADVALDAPIPLQLSRTNSGGVVGSGRASGDGLPPRKAHRRSQSDIPFGFLQTCSDSNNNINSALLPPLPNNHQFPSHLISPRSNYTGKFVKKETDNESSVEREDDLFNAYLNLENMDTLNSSETEDKREDSRASGSKTMDSSENEAESSVNSGSSLQLLKDGNKRSAVGDPSPISLSSSRHNRSLSMDSLMGKMNFGDELVKMPPSPGVGGGSHSRSGSMDGVTNSAFSLEFGNGEFTAAELKKITANEKLVEIAMADPKRVKRILANRQSAARSKERKMRYISELEHKVQTLQTEATTLSAQLTMFQRDSAGLVSQNNELKFRLQAMEQQAQLREALNEALTAEVHRLKLAAGEAQLANSLNQQMQLNSQNYPRQQQQMQNQQQSSQISHYQQQQQQNQKNENDEPNIKK